ncbi:MAG: aminopeptidase [Akkermansiaceae bacterium]
MIRFKILPFPLLIALLVLPACQAMRFYGQAAGGQMEIIRKSRSNPAVIADVATTAEVRQKLLAVEGIRRFAIDYLSLPGDKSYGRYADLGRKHVVWVLYASPEFSLEPKTWSYPIVGEMDYRGYFREQDTRQLASQLRAEGYDVHVGGVNAYSTLGWLHDPMLNTFIHYPDIDLAETIFHELTHRKYFRRGDTIFNESLANAVAEEGVRRWLRHEGRLKELEAYKQRLVRRGEFYREIDRARLQLEALYASRQPVPAMRRQKAEILTNLRGQFLELRRQWGGSGLDSWVKTDINNGHIISLQLYHQHIPAFERLLAESGGDLDRFFERVRHFKIPG